jgi:hypothetical protein
MDENTKREESDSLYGGMKEAAKFALVNFSLAILFLIIGKNIFTNSYSGDSFLIIWLFVFNIVVGVILFPLLVHIIRLKTGKNSNWLVGFYFLAVLLVTNIIPLLSGHIFYSVEIVNLIFRNTETSINGIIELSSIVISYILTCLIFRNSKIWLPLGE